METSNIIVDKILAYQRKKLSYLFGAGIINVLFFLVLIWLSTLVIDSVFFFSTAVRWFLLITNVILSLYLIARLIVFPFYSLLKLNKKSNLSSVAKEIGTFYPQIKDKLVNIYQLCKDNIIGASSSLKNFAIADFTKRINDLDFRESVKFIGFILPIPLTLTVLAGGLFLSMTMHSTLLISLKRIIDPPGEYAAIPAYQFNVTPGNGQLLIGQSLDIKTSYQGPGLQACLLEYKNTDELFSQSAPMSYKDGYYFYTLKNVRRPMEYQIRGIPTKAAEWSEKLLSAVYQVQIIIPPIVTEIDVTILPPGYTNLPRQMLEKNVGDIVAYPGSKISISARTNKNVERASLKLSDNTEIKMDIREEKLKTDFVVNNSKSYYFQLTDQEGVLNQNPIDYSITILNDIDPSVEIIEPGEDVEISVDAALNLLIEGNDDFGFNKMQLHYQILSSSEIVRDTTWNSFAVLIPAENVKYFQQNFLWNFANISVGFEDAIKYFISLEDNDRINGPKVGYSMEYMIRFPSLQQLFDEFADKQDDAVANLDDLAKDSEELQKKLEEINRELKRESKIDWERKKQIESTLEDQQNIQEKLEKIQQELSTAIEKLQQNQLFSPEILEKYRQLQNLFQDIASPELLQAMKELQKAIEDLNRKEVQNALQKFKINQEQFEKTLDRTLELFKRVQLEQEIDQLVKMAQKMSREQNDITSELDKSDEMKQEDLSSLNKRGEVQEKTLDQTTKLLSNILEENIMLQYPDARDLLQLSKEQINQNQMASNLSDLKQMLSAQDRNNALNMSQKLNQDMQELASNLQRAQKEMITEGKEQIMKQMYKVAENLLTLSSDQEDIMNETKELSNYSDKFSNVAVQQQKITENMGRVIKDIIDLSQKTFFITPELSKALGRATGAIRKSLNELENRNQNNSSKSQAQAMAAMNEAVIELQNSMQMMLQSSSALGFEQFLQRMQQLAGKQGQLNQQGLDLFNSRGNQGSLTIEQQGQMRRMAAEQQAVREALEQLNNEMGDRSDILGRLDNMAEEMDKVVKDLEQLKIDRKTIERQQQILSRMLDTQKSVREKEYSRQRKAEVGKEYARKSPSSDMDTIDKRAEKLRLNLMQALKEGYHPDYEKLIEDYFRRLNQNDLKE